MKQIFKFIIGQIPNLLTSPAELDNLSFYKSAESVVDRFVSVIWATSQENLTSGVCDQVSVMG